MLHPEDEKRIDAAVRWVERQQAGKGGAQPRRAVPNTPDVAVVRCTSATAADGHYPGKIIDADVNVNPATYTDGDDCWLLFPDGSTPTAGATALYTGRLSGVWPADGYLVYLITGAIGGTEAAAGVADAAFGVAGKINTADQVWGSGDKAAPEDFIVGWSTAGDHTLSFSEDTAFTGHLTYLQATGTAATQRQLVINTGTPDNQVSLWMRAGPSSSNLAFFQFGADGADATFPPEVRIQTDAFGSVVSGDTTTVAGLQFTSGWLTGGSFTGYASGGTDVALADGGTGASLADPGADRILFWDDSAGAVTWLEVGSGLSITDTTIAASGSGLPADPGADAFLVWDDSDGAAEWWTLASNAGLLFSGSTLSWSASQFGTMTDPLAGTDSFVIYDASATATLAANISTILTYVVNNLTAADIPAFNGLTNSTPADADRFPFYDDGVGNRDCSGSELKTYIGALAAASQAEMETATATDRTVTPGRTQYHPGVAKGWVYFDGSAGTPAVIAGHNVSSITDSTTGSWVVVWGTDFSTANYCVNCSSEWDSGVAFYVSGINGDVGLAAGSAPVANAVVGGGLADARFIMVAAFGDQA
jgi:hypothetical protein